MRCQPLIPYFPITISSSDQDFCVKWPRRHEIIGKPGPMTKALQSAFFDVIRGRNTKHAGWLDYLAYTDRADDVS
jgi:hypothetical protein